MSEPRLVEGYYTGWRAWSIREIDDRIWLVTKAGTNAYVWPMGKRAEATCAKHNPVPCSERCAGYGYGCGFYASKERVLIPFPPGTEVMIVGKVSLWGTIKIHRTGYRAEFAYPQLLRACRTTTSWRKRKGLLETLSRNYGLQW